MSAKRYPFQVGHITCEILLDGATHVGRETLVSVLTGGSEAEYDQAYADLGLSLDDADSSFNILLAKIGRETVLVDTGQAGQPNGGLLQESLRQAGVAPEAVTLVIITHSHGDHIFGLLSAAQEPTFPNATYVISTTEMAFWRERVANGSASPLYSAIDTMMAAKGLRLIEMDEIILPGLQAVPLPGHTPGQIGLLLESEGQGLLHLADLLHTPIQFAHPAWSPAFDADTSLSIPTRHAALHRAAAENHLTLFYHLTFPGLGRVSPAEKGFTWAPVQPHLNP